MPIESVLPKISQITRQLAVGDIIFASFASVDAPASLWITDPNLQQYQLWENGPKSMKTHVNIDGPGITTEMLEVIPKYAGVRIIEVDENHNVKWWKVVPA